MLFSNLPDHCEPTNDFLYHFSATFGTCVPTNLAFISTALGCLSIAAWLFAQLPQIFKNYKIQSTSGLSIFFLVEWCLGDMSNFFGAMLTQQATWQIVIGAYYCFVDMTLVCQWFWYEYLNHGRRLRSMWKRHPKRHHDDFPGDGTVIEGLEPLMQEQYTDAPAASKGSATPQEIPRSNNKFQGFFRNINYGSIPKEHSGNARDQANSIQRTSNQPFPSPSPRTILFISLLIAMAQASPLQGQPNGRHHQTWETREDDLTELLGPLLSWMSTLLYLGSRLPQLLKNHRRRSTAGLSLTLFAAAFHGNLFYSLSLLCNPQAWSSFPAYGCHGWVRATPSKRKEWVASAMPFFLGAAGVLLMDAAVGLQFWWFKEPEGPREIIVVGERRRDGWRWMEVDGWMRGWKPSLSSGRATPVSDDSSDARSRASVS